MNTNVKKRLNTQVRILFFLLTGTLMLFNSCTKDEGFPKPLITDFTPTEGIAGETEVIVIGNNFSSEIEKNSVKFGSIISTITAATTTSLTVLVPAGAQSGKISVTTNGFTSTSANDFIVLKEPSDFFRLTIDPSYETSDRDNWIMASSRDGVWIDVQPFEAGEVKVLHGIVPDEGRFNLHFMDVTVDTDGKYSFSLVSYGEIEIDNTWLLKIPIPASNPTYDLNVQVSNIILNNRPFPNDIVIVSSSAGMEGSFSGSVSGSNASVETRVLENPADIFLTVYQDDFPYYAKFSEVTLPETLIIDASTDVKIADRTYTYDLPDNEYFFISIEAFDDDQQNPFTMAKYYDIDGGASVKLGFDIGYDNYRTNLSYKSGNTLRNYAKVSQEVDENLSLPDFNFNISKTSVADFVGESDLAFDVSSVYFKYAVSNADLRWNFIQPAPDESFVINLKNKPFPSILIEKYSVLPELSLVQFLYVSGYQYMGSHTYGEMISTQSQSGRTTMDMFSYDNYYHFQLRAN